MAARPTGSGTLAFGLVSIPVKIYPTAESAGAVTFDLIHKTCGTHVKRQYVCPKDHKVLGPDDMVKGYAVSKGKYAVFTDAELKALQQESDRTIEIVEFVPDGSVDPVLFGGASFLGPDKGGTRPFLLLAGALRTTKRSAVARWSARGRQHLVLVQAGRKALVMRDLHYAGEVRAEADVPMGEAAAPTRGELALAVKLVNQISAERFDAKQYADESRERIRAAIRRKAKGEALVATDERPQPKVVDLMAALKASLKRAS